MILQTVKKYYIDNNYKINTITCNTQDNTIEKAKVDRNSSEYKKELLEKLEILRKLEELESHGFKLSKKYNIESDIKEMQNEYKLNFDRKTRENTIAWLRHMFTAIMYGIEHLNEKYNPFYINIKGLTDKLIDKINMSSQMNSILNDVYDRYIVNVDWESVKISPVIRISALILNCILEAYLEAQLKAQLKVNPIKFDANIQSIRNKLSSIDKEQYDNITTHIIDQVSQNKIDSDVALLLKDVIDEVKQEINNSAGNINADIIIQNVVQKVQNKIPRDKLQKLIKYLTN
jgi:gas vesicle protein